ncbi:hypothetical protein ABZ646_47050, partial [Streptomyces sp. NPDC007162]|uniref:NACHT domain-containing protein n=1 Tax=Streptomyces sp. NPDC007162 TaxID=3156917 RepID=UPI00340DBAE1
MLVDGLDEITDPDERKDVLKTVANAGDDYAFVVATRPLHETELGILGPEVPRYHLEPFAPDELEHVATGWFTALGVTEPENGARQFLTAIGRAQLTDLVRVPLTMSMLCQLWAREPGGPLPRGRGEIYGHFVESLQARQYHAHALEQARAAMRQYGSDAEAGAERAVLGLQNMLAAVAHHLLLAKRGDGDRTVLDLVLQHPGAGRPAAVPKKRWRDFLESALCGTGLLTRGSDDLVFTHQTFMEYFAARHVVGDEARLRVVFRKTFVRPARYLPGKDLSPGIRPRLPLSRYWKPPRYDPFDGFLLDLTPQGHPLKREFLSRMASARAGLDGYDYLGKLTRSGVFLPGDIIVSTVGLLRRLVSD